MARTNYNDLLEAGVHFGHMKRKWHPNMAPYIFMERNGIHIIDLHKTVAMLEEAASAMKQIAYSGKKIMFVATKKQAKGLIEDLIKPTNMPYIVERWTGGMLTNFSTIRKAMRKMNAIEKLLKDTEASNLNKKEKLLLQRQYNKLERTIGSISDLSRLPAAIFVVDIKKEHIAIKEAKKLNIPTFAMVDTNSDPKLVDFAIPSNDDAAASINKVVGTLVDAINEGLAERQNLKDKKVEKPAKEEVVATEEAGATEKE